MKLNYLVMLSIASLLSISAGTFTKQLSVRAEPANTSASAASMSGTFVSADSQSSTQGMVRIVTENGTRYLELEENFQTGEAPDLYVILHRSEKPETYEEADYLNLGRLQNLSGTQRYAIPDNVELSNYRSAVIWCREFNVTMGYASLGGGTGTVANPCAGATSNPCAAKPNPCAGATSNPCAAKPNPCAGATSNPCAGM